MKRGKSMAKIINMFAKGDEDKRVVANKIVIGARC